MNIVATVILIVGFPTNPIAVALSAIRIEKRNQTVKDYLFWIWSKTTKIESNKSQLDRMTIINSRKINLKNRSK